AKLTKEDLIEKLQIDIPMPTSYATKELVTELGRLEPYGTANPKPLFAEKDLYIISARIMGKNRNAVRITLKNEQQQEIQAIWFGDADQFYADMIKQYGVKGETLFSGRANDLKLSIAYTIGMNVYMGKESVQLTIQDYC
ncbi:MAG: single-stranded-DNA-specific exonuclease RecJ, partial [Clostridia bacterium]|nr:single-stranded-DNA-specific exonuclease RecJ [Clostridia bacterium]